MAQLTVPRTLTPRSATEVGVLKQDAVIALEGNVYLFHDGMCYIMQDGAIASGEIPAPASDDYVSEFSAEDFGLAGQLRWTPELAVKLRNTRESNPDDAASRPDHFDHVPQRGTIIAPGSPNAGPDSVEVLPW